MRQLQFCALTVVAGLALAAGQLCSQQPATALPDPSIEESGEKNQFGIPYKKWSGWIYEGGAEFRVGKVARSGKSSAEIVGAQGGKIRLFSPKVTVEPGRYRFSVYIRGLDIGTHQWGMSQDVVFADDKYHNLTKTGTFGWTRLDIVKDVPTKKEVSFTIGLHAPGRMWVDDAELVKVDANTPLTNGPVLGQEEKPIAPPGALDPAQAVNCPDCGYRNMPQWGQCYACGAKLEARAATVQGPDVKPIQSFESGKLAPWTASGGNVAAVVPEHATEGRFALQVNKGYALTDEAQNWSGYDFLKADVFNASDDPTNVYIEIRDKATTDYWTRVNYTTVVPPGASTLILPTELYVGEKSRPGRPLDKANITRFVLSSEESKSPLYFDNLRLERDLSDSVKVPGLRAFSFGPGTSAPMPGFTQITPSTLYSPGRGYGLKNAKIWRAFDVLQPDPLYQTFICIESGGFAVDVPNGKYHVFVNIDNPSGYWGEYQLYRQRSIKANGVEVLRETMDLPRFRQKYFRFADVEDSPGENTFDKYQRAYFNEKEFDVDVNNGQLFLEFNGQNWANSVSTVVLYPATQAEAGRKYLNNLQERRRFYFDNYFKRILPNGQRDIKGDIPAFVPTAAEKTAGYVTFVRDWMDNVPVNAMPRREEVKRELNVAASAGELEPIVFSVHALRDLGEAKITISDLVSGNSRIPASAIAPGVVSHRLSRVTMEGTVYTIAPRYVMPRTAATLKSGVTTTFWLTLRTPQQVQAGNYKGTVKLTFADGKSETLDLNARLFATPLDELDVPAGPWGSNISLPWYKEDLGDYNQAMFRKCLAKLREYGLTSFSGIPTLRITGWKDRKPQIDFTQADREMADAKAAGFKNIVINYNGGIQGFDNYYIDEAAMKNAGFTKYTDFLRVILTEVDVHAKAANWLPVAYNLADEPIKDNVARSAANAKAWREAAPPTLLTTGATSMESPKADDPHLPLSRALKIANLNGHDDGALKAIKEGGSDWAFYNGGNRWTFGTYMFKAARQHDMKFRLSWHWNASAGDPYYALDSREDDYAWCSANANGDLIPTIHFEREIREGVDDYRYMLTLSRLLNVKPNHAAVAGARKLLDDKLAAFKLGERNHNAKWPVEEYRTYRLQLAEAIERLAK